MPVSQKFLFTMLLLISVIFLIFIYVGPFDQNGKFILLLLCLFFDVLAFSTKLYMVFFIPFLRMKGRSVVIDNNEAFFMASSGNAILVRKGSDIYASAFIKIPAYRSATEMTPEEKIDFARLFSRALTITNRPVKFSAQLYVINKIAYIDNIRKKLDEVEERYQNAMMSGDISKSGSERIRGEVTMWHNLFDNVNKTNSQALDAYAMISAEGGSEEEAVTIAVQQAQEIAAGISAVFGITATLAEGEDMLKYIEPDYMIPLATVSEQLREKSVAAGV